MRLTSGHLWSTTDIISLAKRQRIRVCGGFVAGFVAEGDRDARTKGEHRVAMGDFRRPAISKGASDGSPKCAVDPGVHLWGLNPAQRGGVAATQPGGP